MEERTELEQAIARLEAQRESLGDAAVDAAVVGLRQRLAELDAADSWEQPKAERPQPHGERRIVTVLFCDVVGSTALAETMDPETWTEIMNAAFERLVKPIDSYDGLVNRLLGDAVLAFFGAPTAHEDDPQRAVLAALEMLENIRPFREKLKREQGLDFDIRIGINTGLAVVGEVGSASHGEYSAMGDAVNVAARMEQWAAPGTIQIAHDTYTLIAPLFEVEELGGIPVKGKSDPVPSYRILGRKAVPARLRGLTSHGISSPLVGRDEEFATAQASLTKLLNGEGGILAILGEAGIGKSRLLAELRSAVESGRAESAREPRVESGRQESAREPRVKSGRQESAREPRVESGRQESAREKKDRDREGSPATSDQPPVPNPQSPTPVHNSQFTIHYSQLNWLEGHTLSYGQTISYWPFQEIFRAYAGIDEDDGEEGAWRKLEGAVRALMPEETAEILPYLASLLSIEVSAEYVERVKFLDGEALGRQVYRAARRFFQRLAEKRPLVLVFDDLHWMDASSAGLVEHLLPLVERVPLLLIGLSRPDPETPAGRLRTVAEANYADRFTVVDLAPLSVGDSGRLVQNLLAIDGLPDHVRQMMVDRADGNPFYLEEIVRNLIEAGAIVQEAGGRWRATRTIEKVNVPDTIQGLLLARIDRLDEELKRVVRWAAVVGRTFPYRVLSTVLEDDRHLEQHLAQLQSVELIREKQQLPELEYIFKHSLAQEAAYDSILLQERRQMHGRVGAAIETLMADRLDEFYGLLAHHYSAAEQWDKAQEYLFKAGDQAGRMAADAEALTHYQQAMEAYTRVRGDDWDPVERASLERKIGEALYRLGEHEQARAYLERAFALLGDPLPTSRWGTRLAILRAILVQVGHRLMPGRFVRPMDSAPDPFVGEYFHTASAFVGLELLVDLERYLLAVVRSLNACERGSFAYGSAIVAAALGIAADFAGRFAIAERYYTLSADYARQVEPYRPLGQLEYGQAIHFNQLCQWDKSLEHARRGVEILRGEGDLRFWGGAQTTVSFAHYATGRFAEAVEGAREMLAVAEEISDRQVACWGYWVLGSALVRQGHLDEARLALQEATELAREVPDYTTQISGGAWLGRALLYSGEFEQASAVLEELLPVYEAWGDSVGGYAVLGSILSELYLTAAEDSTGETRNAWLKKAGKSCKKALKSARRVGSNFPDAQRLMGLYEWLNGNPGAARKWWARTVDHAEKTGMRYYEAMAHLEIGRRTGDRDHLLRAEAILEETGAALDLAAAREALSNRQ